MEVDNDIKAKLDDYDEQRCYDVAANVNGILKLFLALSLCLEKWIRECKCSSEAKTEKENFDLVDFHET